MFDLPCLIYIIYIRFVLTFCSFIVAELVQAHYLIMWSQVWHPPRHIKAIIFFRILRFWATRLLNGFYHCPIMYSNFLKSLICYLSFWWKWVPKKPKRRRTSFHLGFRLFLTEFPTAMQLFARTEWWDFIKLALWRNLTWGAKIWRILRILPNKHGLDGVDD